MSRLNAINSAPVVGQQYPEKTQPIEPPTTMVEYPVKRAACLLVLLVCCISYPTFAASSGGPGGKWPKSWPKELESLRKQAWTWEHGLVGQISYDIPFSSRKEFEAAWPHMIQLKSKDAPLTLLRGPHVRAWTKRRDKNKNAGVRILPPLQNATEGPYSVTRIELVVDGEIVDLNRIRLPADSRIIDKRFSTD